MKKQLTLGSLFDGSGGFPLAGILAGVEPVWASEIEPFAIRVTTKRLPKMRHYGDVSSISGADLEPVDIITFGSPCQDLSIAGKRSGLDGSRSGLFFEAIRIVKEMREKTHGEKPRFIVWENVPGAFSSNKGEDFKAVLEEVIRIKEPEAPPLPPPEKGRWPYADCCLGDGWSVAYRVLDARYWGVPQRRARIFLVADFAGGCAPEILFESEGVSGYTPQGFRQGQGTAGDPKESPGAAGGTDAGGRGWVILNDQGGSRMDVSEDVVSTLRAEAHHPPVLLDEHPAAAGFCTEHSANARGVGYGEETSPTLRAGVVPAAIALDYHPADSRIGIGEPETIQTLTSRMGTGGNNVPLVMDGKVHQELPPQTLKIRSGCEGGGKGAQVQVEKSATLGRNNDQTVFIPYCKGTRPHSAEEGMTIAMLIAACLMLPFFFIFPTEWIFTPRGALCVGMLGVVNAALGFTLELVGFKNTPTLIASTLTLGEPLGAALIGVFVLEEPYTAESLAGIVLLFLSILLLIVGPELKRRVAWRRFNKVAFRE